MRRFINSLLRKDTDTTACAETRPNPATAEAAPRYKMTLSGADLLVPEHRRRTVGMIKKTVSVTNEYWTDNYIYALEEFAEIVQEHPASRQHHHSTTGGLLDHTLDVALRAMRLSAGVILPPNADPEDILHNAERWRFGVLVACLLHDIGKLISDQETVYRNPQEGDDGFVRWLPWHGAMPIGHEYTHRYRDTHGDHIHGLHEIIGITLLPRILTPTMTRWISADRKLLGQLMHTLSASATGSGVIGELIRKADRSSTADNLGPTTGLEDERIKPLHAKILESLQTLANEGRLKRNMPGAGVWVGPDRSWFVAKSTMEKVREHLISAGHSGIPQSPLRLMQILNEHKITIEPCQGDVQQAIVKDTQRDWTQKLSFIVIPNESVWISGVPNRFKGEITPVDDEGNAVELVPTSGESDTGGHTVTPTKVEPDNSDTGGRTATPIKVEQEASSEKPSEDRSSITFKNISEPERTPRESDVPEHAPAPAPTRPAPKAPQPKAQPKTKRSSATSKSEGSDLRNKHPFFLWLLNGIRYRRIKMNQSGAPVHIVDSSVAMIAPTIFKQYLHSNKAAALALGKSEEQQLSRLQRELRELRLHIKTKDNEDFRKIRIRGPRKESFVHAYVIPLNSFAGIDEASPNPMLSFVEED